MVICKRSFEDSCVLVTVSYMHPGVCWSTYVFANATSPEDNVNISGAAVYKRQKPADGNYTLAEIPNIASVTFRLIYLLFCNL